MKYFLDTEFVEGSQDKTFMGIKYGKTKPTIDLISSGHKGVSGFRLSVNEFNNLINS
jgi:hypothetical protein